MTAPRTEQQFDSLVLCTNAELESKCSTPGSTLALCHSQSVERLVKFVAEGCAQVARFDRRDSHLTKKLNH